MNDAFLIGAGFSKAVCPQMPTMKQLFERLKDSADDADGITEEEYDYAAGDVEGLLSYFAITGPQDDLAEVLRKKRVTALLENRIGRIVAELEQLGYEKGFNPRGLGLVRKWHEDRGHILTTNYDTVVERMLGEGFEDDASGKTLRVEYPDLYPIPITHARSRQETGGFFARESIETCTLYKLHGSTTWYASGSEAPSAPIYGLRYTQLCDETLYKFVMDKQRFIIPPVYDKSTLLSHESIRSLWHQAKHLALGPVDRLYIIGYSLPETDFSMRSLLWEGAKQSSHSQFGKKLLYVVDPDKNVGDRYVAKLGQYYDVRTDWVGESEVFNDFVDWYTNGCT